jgi:hypothetical protein
VEQTKELEEGTISYGLLQNRIIAIVLLVKTLIMFDSFMFRNRSFDYYANCDFRFPSRISP